MKPFTLNAVLDYRKRTEDEAHREMVSIRKSKDVLVVEMENEEKELVRLIDEMGAAKCRDIVVSDLILYEACIRRKKREILDIDKKINEVDARIRRQEKKLIKARQDRRALEIVRDNRENEEKQRQKQAEDRFLDEVGVLRFGGSKQ